MYTFHSVALEIECPKHVGLTKVHGELTSCVRMFFLYRKVGGNSFLKAALVRIFFEGAVKLQILKLTKKHKVMIYLQLAAWRKGHID